MNALDLVPGPLKAYAGLAIAAAAAAAIAGAALWHHHAKSQALAEAHAAGLAEGRAELAAYRGQVERDALAQAAKRQAAQVGLDQDQKEIAHEHERIAALDRARLVASTRSVDAADQRLQQRLDAARAAAGGGAVPGGAAVGGLGQAEPGPDARLLGAARRALRQLARDADAELGDVDGRLGECVASYEAVRARVNATAQP